MKRRSRSGVTLLELAIALTILALLAVNVSMVTRTGSEVARSGAFFMALEDDADMTLDRIVLALMSSSETSLTPSDFPPPLNSNEVSYSTSRGLQDGEIVYGPVERIRWEATASGGRVTWAEEPDTEDERAVVWSGSVPTAQMGEILGNGIDDNANGINEECGLAFAKEGSVVGIYLTIERTDPNGKPAARERTKTVTPRN